MSKATPTQDVSGRVCRHPPDIRKSPQGNLQSVRSAYQPPTNSTFLSEQTNHQPAVLFSQNKPAPAISHQPTEQAVSLSCRSLRALLQLPATSCWVLQELSSTSMIQTLKYSRSMISNRSTNKRMQMQIRVCPCLSNDHASLNSPTSALPLKLLIFMMSK
jgi:hypothetical protein